MAKLKDESVDSSKVDSSKVDSSKDETSKGETSKGETSKGDSPNVKRFKHVTHPNVTGNIALFDSTGKERELQIVDGIVETDDPTIQIVLEKEGFLGV